MALESYVDNQRPSASCENVFWRGEFGPHFCLPIRLTLVKVYACDTILSAAVLETECEITILEPDTNIILCAIAWFKTFPFA